MLTEALFQFFKERAILQRMALKLAVIDNAESI